MHASAPAHGATGFDLRVSRSWATYAIQALVQSTAS